MSPSANVLSLQPLEDLRNGLTRFSSEASERMSAVGRDIQQTLDWLAERLRYWQREAQRRQEEVSQARTALARCQASGYRDERGHYHAPDCSAYEQALLQAQVRLREAEAELGNVQRWTQRVQQAAAEYQTQAGRLAAHLNGELPRAVAVLSDKIASLKAYLEAAAPTGAGRLSAAAVRPGTPATAGAGAFSSGAVRSIQEVPLSQIDLSDLPIKGAGDYHKVSADEMREGLRKLDDVVRPAVAEGRDGDYFSQLDAGLGLNYANGYRRIYDAFYGQDAITLEMMGDHYGVINGYHRLVLARAMGWGAIPARVIGPGT